MPYDSEGNFTRVHNWEEDRINDIDIVSDRHDEEDDNFASGLSDCMLRDGRCTMTGNLKMGTFQIKELANATLSTDAVNKGQLDNAKTELTDAMNTMLSTLYPVGSLYMGTQTTCPLTSLITGSTWELVGQDKALWGGNGSNANTTINAGLPNITGQVGFAENEGSIIFNNTSGAIYSDGTRGDGITSSDSYGYASSYLLKMDASRSNSIYGNSSTVQPPAYRVNIWRRTV